MRTLSQRKFGKRILLVMAFMVSLLVAAPFAGTSMLVNAEEVEQEVAEARVIVSNQKGGEILVDITEGNVGDKAIAAVSPYILYRIESVTVNGVNITANEDGNYEFFLVAGDNTINATYVVDKEELSNMANLLADAKQGDWENIFTLSNVLTFIGWFISMIFSSGFFLTLIKTKKIKAKTTDEITAAVEAILNSKLGTAVNNFLENTILPIIQQYNIKIEYTEETCKVLARCFALAQENTPEARLAIINELTVFKNTEQNLNEEVRKIINEEIERNNQEKDQLAQTIEELKQANQQVVKSDNPEDDAYGQI
jgi:hypothetical protein